MAAAPGNRSRFYIQTYGCQMNVADSDRMSLLLERAGGEAVSRPEDADLILLNTCSVREKPEVKVYSRLGELRKLKRANPDLVLGVCGCQAQREGETILRQAPYVDLVIGTANVDRVPELVDRVRTTGERLVALEMPARGTPAWMAPDPHMTTDLVDLLPATGPGTGRLKAFVPVILGCDFACTYCVVPRTRGPERSRPAGDVLGEVRALAQGGTREVMLLGQTVDAYRAYYRADGAPGDRVYGLADLIRLIGEVDGIQRIRFTSPHPMLMGDDLIRAIAEVPQACEWIHLPVQSGSNAVLKRMARRYDRERYRERVRAIRAGVPGCALTTDIIVGFPGETEEDFAATLSLVEEVRFDGAYMFAYSPRPGTPAYGWEGELPRATVIERLNRLIAVQNRISLENNEAAVGREVEVLVEGPSEQGDGLFTGLTRENKTVHLPGHPGMVGRLVRARAERAAQWGWFARALEPAPASLHVLA